MKRVSVKSSVEDYESSVQRYNEAVQRHNDQQKSYDRQKKQFNVKNKASEDVVSFAIRDMLEDATSPEFMQDVDVFVGIDFYSRSNTYGKISVDYGENRKFDDDVPLVWNWTFYFSGSDDSSGGKTNRETSSWSGLNATTAENINILKQSVSALETLAKVNDTFILNLLRSNAIYKEDYVTQKVDKVDTAKYLQEQLEALAGTGMLIRTEDNISSERYIELVKSTPSQFTVTTYSVRKPSKSYDYRVNDYVDSLSKMYTFESKRYRKDKVYDMVKLPLVVKSRDDISSMMLQWDKEYKESQKKDSEE